MNQSPELERVVLGACLLEDEGTLELIAAAIEPNHFALDSHQKIFKHILKLHRAQKPANMVTVLEETYRAKEDQDVGGASYLASLTEGLPRKIGERVTEYTERLKEFWRLRQLAILGDWLAGEASANSSEASEVIRHATERLESIVSDSEQESAEVAYSVIPTLDEFERQRKVSITPGLSFGHAELDSQTGGMMPGFQTAVGASSGVGKTTFMCQAILATLKQGHPVDAFLLEPTKAQVIMRLASLLADVEYRAVTKPWTCNLTNSERLRSAALEIAEMPLRLHARASMTLDDVLGQARVGINRRGTRLICLDYIQRLKVRTAERDEPLRQRIARASSALADLVKNTQCHSLLLSQLNTGRRNGAQAIPTMFDFRESSQIENDARLIVLLHREYDETNGHYTTNGAFFVPKHTFGVPCNLKVYFDPRTASWA